MDRKSNFVIQGNYNLSRKISYCYKFITEVYLVHY